MSTPTICDGRDGVKPWVTDDPAYGLAVRALDSGTCKFTVSVDGMWRRQERHLQPA